MKYLGPVHALDPDIGNAFILCVENGSICMSDLEVVRGLAGKPIALLSLNAEDLSKREDLLGLVRVVFMRRVPNESPL